MQAILALIRKDFLTTLRAPRFAIVSVVVPLAFATLYAIIVHVSTTATVAVALYDESPEAQSFVEAMLTIRNEDGLYYEVRTTDPETAEAMFSSGRSGAVVTIPAGFGDAINRGERATVQLRLFNINADATKNHHLRLIETIRSFSDRAGVAPRLTFEEDTVFSRDIPISIYLGSALIVFAALYSGMINSGTLIAQEWEGRTFKVLVMSPFAPLALVVGKWMAGGIWSIVTIVAATLSIAFVLDIPLAGLGWQAGLVLSLVWLYGAAFGSFLATIFRRSLPLIPVAVVLAVVHFLVSGYESFVRGFAHGGAVETLWRGTEWIPLAALTDALRYDAMNFGTHPDLIGAVVWSFVIILVATAFAMVRVTRQVRLAQGQ